MPERRRPPRASLRRVDAVEARPAGRSGLCRIAIICSGWRSPAPDHAARAAPSAVRRLAGVDGVGELPRRHAAGLAEERLDVAGAELRAPSPYVAASVGSDAVEAADVLAEVLGDRRRRAPASSLHAARRGLARRPRPGGRSAGRRRRCRRDVPAGRLHRVGQRLRQPPAAADEHQLGRRQRVGEVADERRQLVGGEAPDVAGDHDPPLGEERRRLGGVDDGAQLDVLAVELVDHQATGRRRRPARGRGR